ncbi:MAG: hypothetical protein RML56_10795 [Burkholderiales bacterium]|nr:hypothetical protein [Burkholderiales bacterium]
MPGRRLHLALLPLLACGCAAPRGQRSGASPDESREDLAACRAAAAERIARTAPATAPPMQIDPRFGATEPQRPAERRMEEERLVDACMREKGYRLAPAAPQR